MAVGKEITSTFPFLEITAISPKYKYGEYKVLYGDQRCSYGRKSHVM